MFDLVIAHYNSSEYENTLDHFRLPELSKIIVYDKSNILPEKEGIVIKRLENIGREAETYLYHIIENYDSLEEYTVFIQDDTDNHIPNISVFINQLKNTLNSKNPVFQFPCSWRKGGAPGQRSVVNGYVDLHTFSSRDGIAKATKELGIYLPEYYTTELCAFFMVHRDKIRERPLEFYKKLRTWLLAHWGHGFELEHMWHIIFR